MTSLLELLFPKRVPANPVMAQVAHKWERRLPPNLAKLPGYKPGRYVQSYNHQLTAAIEAATSPDISKMSTLIKPQKQPTNPLAARDIERANTPPEISQLATLKNNPATTTPEVRAALFAEDVPNVAETLILWEPDPDATDRRVIVRKIDAPRNTRQIPAMQAEILLESMMRKPAHEQSTGENERLPEKNWMC